jgi:hypothetical protein
MTGISTAGVYHIIPNPFEPISDHPHRQQRQIRPRTNTA